MCVCNPISIKKCFKEKFHVLSSWLCHYFYYTLKNDIKINLDPGGTPRAHSVSAGHSVRAPLATCSFPTRSVGSSVCQAWWNLDQSKVLLLSFISISNMAAFDVRDTWTKLLEVSMQDFLPFLDHGHSRNKYQRKEQSIFYEITIELKVKTIRTSNTEPPKLVNKGNFWRSHAVSHGRWGDRTMIGGEIDKLFMYGNSSKLFY